MENWLQNKETLRSLLKRGDLANTINGGTCETFIGLEKTGKETVITAYVPGIHTNDFKVMLHKNRLSILRYLAEEHQAKGKEKWMVPVFYRTYDLPATIKKENIEARYEEGVLKVILPMEDPQNLNREISIEQV